MIMNRCAGAEYWSVGGDNVHYSRLSCHRRLATALKHAYDVIEMCVPAATPIRLAIRTRTQTLNPNPNPNPKSNKNVCGAKRHPNKVQDSVINISYIR